MASTGFVQVTNSNNRYTHTLRATVIGQDVAANTTTLSYEYTVDSNTSYANGAWTTLHNVTFHAVVNGTDHTATPNFDFRVNKHLSAVSGTVTIANNTDGSLTVSLGLSCNTLPGSIYFTSVSVSNSTALPVNDIPRASTFTVTPNPVIDGATVTLAINRVDPTFTHDITYVSGVNSGTIATAVGTSTTWTPSHSLLGSLNRVGIAITVLTRNAGGTQIGDPVSVDLIMKAAPVYPTVGVGTPYDIRFRRVALESGKLVPKEEIPYLQATTTDTLSASATCTLDVSESLYATNLDEAVVLADFFDGGQWLNVGMLLVLTRTEGDRTDLDDVTTYTGQAYVDYLLSKNQVKADLDWPVTTTGDIIWQYITIAKARGWGPFVTTTFSKTSTSLGTAWKNTTDINASANTPVSQLLDGFVTDAQCEYASHFDFTTGMAVLDMWNPGYGQDWSVDGADPIVNLSTTALSKVASKAPVRKDFSEKLTRVNVTGDENTAVTREASTNVNPLLGHLEGSVAATGVKDPTQLAALGDATLTNNATATVERTYSYDLSSRQTSDALFPYRTFRPGDWILAPGDTGLERVRVSQVAITRDVDGTTATITVGDIIPSGVAATARKLVQAGGNAIAGGTLQSPLPLSAAIPAAPTGLSDTPGAFWDSAGIPRASIQLEWSPVYASLSRGNITVDLYEVWTRVTIGEPWALALVTTEPVAVITPLDINVSVDFEVRARSAAGVYGGYSDILTVVTGQPITVFSGPDLIDLYTDGVGSIYAVWGGLVGGAAPAAEFGYVSAEISSDGGVTYASAGTPITAAGTIVINPNAYDDYLVRLRAYDRLGNPGTAGTATAITTVDPHVNPATPNAPTGLAATPGASWDATGFLPEAWFDLTWTAPTLDTLGNAITIAGYDILGLRSGETVERLITSVNTNAARIPVGNNEVWSFRVRASSNFGASSVPSASITATANATISAAAAPTPPTLDQYAGLLRVLWAGGGMVPQIKTVFATVSSTLTGTYVRAGMPLLGAGEIIVPGLAPGNYYAKIVIVDELGNTSTSAAAGPITLLPITGITYQTSPLANTGIKITTGSLTSYNAAGNPTFILNAATGEVWIGAYDAVFDLGAAGTVATTGAATTGIAISDDNSPFNTFIHPSGVQIRNNETPLSWWEADATDASLVNFFSPRAVIGSRLRVGDYEMLVEAKTTGTRLVKRYKGA